MALPPKDQLKIGFAHGAYRMAESGVTRVPVVDRRSGHLAGLLTLDDMLKARLLQLDVEHRRERVIRWPRTLAWRRDR